MGVLFLTKRPERPDLPIADVPREVREAVSCAFRCETVVGVGFDFRCVHEEIAGGLRRRSGVEGAEGTVDRSDDEGSGVVGC